MTRAHTPAAALLAALLGLSLLLSGCAPAAEPPESPSPTPTVTPTPEPTPTEVTATLAVAGDVMSHMPVTEDAYVPETDSYDYSHIFQYAAPYLTEADYAVANLETTLAGGPNYSGYPNFNSPDALADGLRDAGIDLLSTANNHTKDKGYDGIFRTLDVLDEAGLAHVGTYRSQEERDENHGIVVADVGGISVAFLSYTYGLNGYTVSEEQAWCVNLFNLDYATTLEQPDYDLLAEDLAYAESLDTDLVAVMIHWGLEYWDDPTVHQTSLAEFLVANGADLVLGGHPHVLEHYTFLTTEDETGAERTGFVCYSLGNFISSQTKERTETTAVLRLELHKDLLTGETTVSGVDYVPFYMLNRGNGAPQGEQFYLLDTHAAMAEHEAGESGLVTDGVYAALEKSLAHAHDILGAEGDAFAAPAPAEPESSAPPAESGT